MEVVMTVSEFTSGLEKYKIELSNDQLAKFDTYRKLLQEYNKVMNLTAIVETDEIYLKHFYDSLTIAFFIDLQGSLLDVGAGAGFPSIPLKILYPELDVTILEPNNKRVRFLEIVCNKLEINVKIIAERAEDYIKASKIKYDFTTARAVANLSILAELCLPFNKVNGYFIAMKGSQYEAELAEAESALKVLNASVENIYTLDLAEARRSIIKIKKDKPTNKRYPRNFGQIKKRPL